MAGNLTRDEARERARLLKVESYDVKLDLTEGEERFESVTTVRFSAAEPGATTFIDLHGARVRSVELNGVALDVAAYDEDKGRFPLPGLAAENELVVDADCAYMRTGEGLHRFVDPEDQKVYLHTQFETADAHRMYACFDQPDLKATFELTVIAPADWEVVSNAAADAVEELAGHQGPPRRDAGGQAPPLRAHRAHLDLHHRAGGRRLPQGDLRARRHPAGHLLPRLAGRAPRRRQHLRAHPPGLRLLP
ncbi:hypothetical protein GCM10020219_003820 [Nonomuraea dietziae]